MNIQNAQLRPAGGLYISIQDNFSPNDCYPGIFPSKMGLESACGIKHEIAPGESCAFSFALSNSTNLIVVFRTVYNRAINSITSVAQVFARDGNLFSRFESSYTGYYHTWRSGFKFSILLQVILTMHFLYLICSEIGKVRSTKEYWRKIKSYFQLCLIFLQFSSMIVYIVREVNMERGSRKFLVDQDASDFYYINQLSHDIIVIQGYYKPQNLCASQSSLA